MSFVHGHARNVGWVMAHRRRPNDAEDGQLPLLAVARPDDAVPEPRTPPDNADGAEAVDQPPVRSSEPAVTSARKSAITRS